MTVNTSSLTRIGAYNSEEQRVVDYIYKIAGGPVELPDPIGAIIFAHSNLMKENREMRAKLESKPPARKRIRKKPTPAPVVEAQPVQQEEAPNE